MARIVGVGLFGLGGVALVRGVRGRGEAGARPASVHDDPDALGPGRGPRHLVAALLVFVGALQLSLSAVRTWPHLDWPTLPFVVVGELFPFASFAALFAVLAMLTTIRARAIRQGRPFPIADAWLVLGFLLPFLAGVHAVQVARHVIRAFPESRRRSPTGKAPLAPWAIAATSGVALYWTDVLARMIAPPWARATWPEWLVVGLPLLGDALVIVSLTVVALRGGAFLAPMREDAATIAAAFA